MPAWADLPLLTAVLGATAAAAAPARLMDIAGKPPQKAVVTLGPELPAAPLDTGMARLAAGVLAEYDRDGIGRLLACETGEAPPPGRSTIIAYLHLASHLGTRRLELRRLADGTTAVAGAEGAALLEDARFADLAKAWPDYRGGFGPPADQRGVSFVLPRPYVPGEITLDARTQKRRLYRGMPVRTADPDRDLGTETLHARLPAGYDPRHPAGLVVWCSPTADGRIPEVLGPALDDLGLIAAGAERAGNQRDVPDKFQLVFDAIATAARRYHVDERRVYVAGMSGGAKVASILAVCFPDVFAGAVAVAGFGSYATLDETWGEHRYPYYARPAGRLPERARARRIALMSGPRDFNYREMRVRFNAMRADGFENLRFFSYPDMGHVMPGPERFAEALAWVDAPYRAMRAAERDAAAALLEAHRNGRATLSDVIEAGPFTGPAWTALEQARP